MEAQIAVIGGRNCTMGRSYKSEKSRDTKRLDSLSEALISRRDHRPYSQSLHL